MKSTSIRIWQVLIRRTTYIVLMNLLDRPIDDLVRVYQHGDLLTLRVPSLALKERGRHEILLLISGLVERAIGLELHSEEVIWRTCMEGEVKYRTLLVGGLKGSE
jgi:hypothetical protein